MQAILAREFGGPDVLRLESVPDPEPGPEEVLVRVRAAGVNPVDTYIRTGQHARKPPLPYTPGSDGAGEVAAVGANVRGFARDDRVYFFGTSGGTVVGAYAELAACTATQIYPLPDRTSYAQGAALGVPYATAFRALFQLGHAAPGETVLVHGATGGVGLAAVQFAHAAGLTVIGTGGTDAGLHLVRAQGADVVVHHGAPGYTAAIMDATAGRGVDLVLEMAAHLNLDRDLGLLAPRGRVVIIGNRGRIEIDPRQLMGRDSQVTGMLLFNASAADVRSAHAAIHAGLSTGVLAPVIARELPLADAARAHELVLQAGALGKIVLVT